MVDTETDVPTVWYQWRRERRISDWRLEGLGEVLLGPAGELVVRTYHCGPGRRATNLWLRGLELPKAFRLSWRFRSEAAAGNTMCLFNAQPVALADLFDDSRPEARYCDLASWGKMVTHTCGFHRGVYGNECVLRKIGGKVPEDWGMLEWPGEQWKECDRVTRLGTTNEPLRAEDRGKWHDFAIERKENRIQFMVNWQVVHDVIDEGQYPFWREPLVGGKIGFRNFGGYAEDVYEQITLEAL